MGQIWFRPNFKFGIFRIKSRKVENGRKKSQNRFRSDFEFDVPNFEPNSNLFENTNLIGLNVKNDAVRYGIFPYHFHPKPSMQDVFYSTIIVHTHGGKMHLLMVKSCIVWWKLGSSSKGWS